MAHGHCMLDTRVAHALTICVIYCFSSATMAARTLVVITFYVHCLYC
jgi:hypothetical protein